MKTRYTSALVISLLMGIAGAGTALAEYDSLGADPFEPALAAEDDVLRDPNHYFMKIKGGEFSNLGNIFGHCYVSGSGVINLYEGGSTQDILMTDTGTINVLGENANVKGALTLLGGTVTFSPGAYINMNGNQVTLEDVEIVVVVDDSVIDNPAGITLDLFRGSSTVSGLEDASYVLSNEDGTVMKEVSVSSAGGSSVVISGGAVPEPTTATLSLLALAGLASRRRRR